MRFLTAPVWSGSLILRSTTDKVSCGLMRLEDKMKIREDLMISGNKIPNFERPDQDGIVRTLEDLMRGWPTILVFWRGAY